MRSFLIGVVALASCYPSDPTSISGTYDGNATYTISPGSGGNDVTGALGATIDVSQSSRCQSEAAAG